MDLVATIRSIGQLARRRSCSQLSIWCRTWRRHWTAEFNHSWRCNIQVCANFDNNIAFYGYSAHFLSILITFTDHWHKPTLYRTHIWPKMIIHRATVRQKMHSHDKAVSQTEHAGIRCRAECKILTIWRRTHSKWHLSLVATSFPIHRYCQVCGRTIRNRWSASSQRLSEFLQYRIWWPIYLQVHSGIKGIVTDSISHRPIAEAVIWIKNVTIAGHQPVLIKHPITSCNWSIPDAVFINFRKREVT